jgi:hypothetical protein
MSSMSVAQDLLDSGTVRAVADLAAIGVLFALLLQREVVRAYIAPATTTRLRPLVVVSVPLLITFTVIVATRALDLG